MEMVGQRHIVPLVTTALFLEYEEVLKRPEHIAAHGLALPEIDRFLAALASAASPVEVHFAWRPRLSDPKDEMVLEAAVNGQARAIVTFNVRDFRDAACAFGIAVLTPGELIRRIEQ